MGIGFNANNGFREISSKALRKLDAHVKKHGDVQKGEKQAKVLTKHDKLAKKNGLPPVLGQNTDSYEKAGAQKPKAHAKKSRANAGKSRVTDTYAPSARPAQAVAAAASATGNLTIGQEVALTKFKGLAFNMEASRAIAEDLMNDVGDVAIASYGWGSRGDALRPAVDELRALMTMVKAGSDVAPQIVEAKVRDALKALQHAKVAAPSEQLALLAQTADAIVATLNRTLARFSKVEQATYETQVEERRRLATVHAAQVTIASQAGGTVRSNVIGMANAAAGGSKLLAPGQAGYDAMAQAAIKNAGPAVALVNSRGGLIIPERVANTPQIGSASLPIPGVPAGWPFPGAATAPVEPPPKREVLGWQVPDWLTFRNAKPILNEAAKAVADKGWLGGVAAGAISLANYVVPDNW